MSILFVAHNLFPISPPHGVSLCNQFHLSRLYLKFPDLIVSTCHDASVFSFSASEYYSNPNELTSTSKFIHSSIPRTFCFFPIFFIRQLVTIYNHLYILKPHHIYISCFQTGISEAYALVALLLGIPYTIISHGVSIFPRYYTFAEIIRFFLWIIYLPLLVMVVLFSSSMLHLPYSSFNSSISAKLRRVDLFFSWLLHIPVKEFLPLTLNLSSSIDANNPSHEYPTNSVHDICWVGSSSHIKNVALFLDIVSRFPSLTFGSLDNLPSDICYSSFPNLKLYDSKKYTGLDIIRTSSSLLITSHSEVFPIIFLEAIASRRSVISNMNSSIASLHYERTFFYFSHSSLVKLIDSGLCFDSSTSAMNSTDVFNSHAHMFNPFI